MSREQRAAIDAVLRRAPQGFRPEPVDRMRENFAQMMSMFPVPETTREDIVLAGRPALVLEPLGGPTREGTILYLHGGSLALGSPTTALGLTASLVTKTGMRAISLDYRLAPEHPFPSAIEDCLAAYRALLDEGIEPKLIAFAGDSAGGGLSVTTTLAAKNAGIPVPGAVVAFSPGLDNTRTGESMDTKAGLDPFFTREGMDYTGEMYLNGQDPNQELLAPAVLADMRGFPPLLLQVGTNELLLDDSVRLAGRARDAEVDVILDVTAQVPHVFQSFIGQLEEADDALDRAALFLRQRIRRS